MRIKCCEPRMKDGVDNVLDPVIRLFCCVMDGLPSRIRRGRDVIFELVDSVGEVIASAITMMMAGNGGRGREDRNGKHGGESDG